MSSEWLVVRNEIFDIKEIEQAKQWLFNYWKKHDLDFCNSHKRFYITKCTSDNTDGYVIYELTDFEIHRFINKAAFEKIQQESPALTNEAVEQIIDYLVKHKTNIRL